MSKDDGAGTHENGFRHFFEWVDTKLAPAFGDSAPTPIGDAGTPPEERPCPLCGHLMSEHVIERSTLNTTLECPTGERLPLPTDGPVDEFGMPASEERLLKLARRR
ncbi:MAG: hypothetical protein ABWX82_07005 [Leifsonia sp.]